METTVTDSQLHKKALQLSYFTVGYNILEGIVSIFAGIIAGSIALVGFGLDSFVESLSGSVMIWRFRRYGKVSEEELSLALLIGLGPNYLYGFWQANPVVGLIIVAFLMKEGYSTLRE